MRALTRDPRLESLWLVSKRRSSNGILRNKIPYRFQIVSESVFGTYDAAFVQAMYEEYLRDPNSVGQEWRELFENGKLAELPIIPTDARETGNVTRETLQPTTAAPAQAPTFPVSRVTSPVTGATPITGPAARLVANMTES